MWFDSRRLVIFQATEFCSHCNLLMLEDEVRCNTELQQSSHLFITQQSSLRPPKNDDEYCAAPDVEIT